MTSEAIATSDLFDLYAFPLSRQLYALNQVAHALGGYDDALLCRWVADAIRLGEQAYELQVTFSRRSRNTEFGAQARIVDRELDRAIGAVGKFMAVIVQAHGETSAQAQLARFATSRLFPEGVAAVIHLPYVEEEIAVRMLLRRATTEPGLSQALHELGAEPFLERVATLHARYQEALRNRRPQPSFAQVKAARQAGQERLCKIVALLLVRLATGGQEAAQAAALRKALHEIKNQNAALGRLHRRRRGVTEVDPETGEEVGAEEEESAEERVEDVVEKETSPHHVGKASQPAVEAIESRRVRDAEAWSPGALHATGVRGGLAMRRHQEQPRAG